MPNDINTIGYLQAGIKAEGVRQQAIAGNIANMNTPGYRRIDVRFSELLRTALESNEEPAASDLEAALFQPKTNPVNSNGNDVVFDREVGEMIKNSLKHRTFTLLLKKKYRQIDDAIKF